MELSLTGELMKMKSSENLFQAQAELPPADNAFLHSLYAGSNTSDKAAALTNERSWGSCIRIDVGYRYQVKRLTIETGAKIPFHYHYHRAEYWIIIAGCVEVTIDKISSVIGEGETIFVPQGVLHQCINVGRIPVILIEVQIGSYTCEDDMVLLQEK